MSQQHDGPTMTFTAGAALAQYRRVRMSTGKLAYAGAADTDCLGTLENPTFADGDEVAVRIRKVQGTSKMVANGAISQYAACYAAASGKIASSGSVLVGVTLEEATTDGDVVEVLESAAAVLGSVARSGGITQDDLQPYAIPLTEGRIWDAPMSPAATTATSDDLAVIVGTFLSTCPILKTSDGKATTVTQKVRYRWAVPIEYVAGQTLTLRLNCGMVTTVSDGTATVDAQVARAADPTVDICATAAQSINSLTAANKDFTLTPTSVVPGDILDIVLTIAITDSATGTAVYGSINTVTVLADVKG